MPERKGVELIQVIGEENKKMNLVYEELMHLNESLSSDASQQKWLKSIAELLNSYVRTQKQAIANLKEEIDG